MTKERNCCLKLKMSCPSTRVFCLTQSLWSVLQEGGPLFHFAGMRGPVAGSCLNASYWLEESDHLPSVCVLLSLCYGIQALHPHQDMLEKNEGISLLGTWE
ncbi:hypothetical protein E2C01_044123 [Portunus trituberculatus]|uniref:Uncharacterized protein n=1 Tax=Portunus trituberculatus TaxID=210409 RepID=A0A5B7FYJ3_PORTR|nr:hypothetical protein [Portunus trituberculatus]